MSFSARLARQPIPSIIACRIAGLLKLVPCGMHTCCMPSLNRMARPQHPFLPCLTARAQPTQMGPRHSQPGSGLHTLALMLRCGVQASVAPTAGQAGSHHPQTHTANVASVAKPAGAISGPESPLRGLEDVRPNQQLLGSTQSYGNPTFDLPRRDDEAAAWHLVRVCRQC